MEFIFSATIILIFIVGYWSLVVFPKQRDFKKHQQYVQTLQVGDEVVSYGGIIGTVVELNDDIGTAVLRIAEGVEVKILTAALHQKFDPDELAHNIRMARGVDDTTTTQ
ncbi:MAG: preprotein translocase subunit YajC [Anaerolineae bacterium]|nr:preprotein translocase subunit YajC [Anaerolineae bacterium]